MVDSRNFKKNNNESGIKKYKWIPLVVIVVLALILIAIQYIMLDILTAVNNPDNFASFICNMTRYLEI